MMNINQAMEARHSVRSFKSDPLPIEVAQALRDEIARCNAEGSLNIQLVLDEPHAFDCMMARYGKFSGVRNYLALVGPKGRDLDEACGYYGERLVLLAQQLGLNTCWVAMTFQKVPNAYTIGRGEKLAAVIALGYGTTQGTAHKVKLPQAVAPNIQGVPDWFVRGVDAALLAPTAMNQQKFTLIYEGENRVRATPGRGFYAKMDLGIVRYHFECGALPTAIEWL